MISVVLVVINTVVIEQIFRRVVHMDHYDTQTKYIINLSQKLTIAQFINSAIVTCVIDILYNGKSHNASAPRVRPAQLEKLKHTSLRVPLKLI